MQFYNFFGGNAMDLKDIVNVLTENEKHYYRNDFVFLSNQILNEYNQLQIDLNQKRESAKLLLMEYNNLQIQLIDNSKVIDTSKTQVKKCIINFSDVLTQSTKQFNDYVDLINEITILEEKAKKVLNKFSDILNIIYDLENLNKVK